MATQLPTKWRGAYLDVAALTDAQRREAGLSHNESIVEVIADDALVLEAVEYARSREVVSVDTETEDVDAFTSKIILVQIGDAKRQYLLWWQTLSSEAKAVVKAFLNDAEARKAGVNLKFDCKAFLAQEGLDWRMEGVLDTMLIEQVIGCGLLGVDIGHTLKLTGMGPMALRWLGWKLPKDEEIRTGWGAMTPGAWYPTRDEVEFGLRLGDSAVTREAVEQEYQRRKTEGLAKRYYAADDCVVPVKLLRKQTPWVVELGLVDTVKLEMEFLPDLAEMEINGLLMDWEAWEALAKESVAELAKAERALDELFDVNVTYRVDMAGNVEVTRDKNYGAKDELKALIREWMWEHKGIDVVGNNRHLKESLVRAGMNPERVAKVLPQKMVPNPDKPGTKKQVGYPNMADYLTGSAFVDSVWERFLPKLTEKAFRLPSTDSKALRLLKILHETPDDQIDDLDTIPTFVGLPPALVDPILDFRKYGKRVSQYAYSWKDLIHPVTGRIHVDFSQCASNTGRKSSRPNLQNIPGAQVYRTAVCRARPGYKIVGADWSQIEPRIIAEMSDCRMYMRIFWSGRPGTKGFAFWCGPEVTEELDLYGGVGATVGTLPPEAEKKSIAKLPESKPGRSKSKIAVLGLGYGTGKPKFHISFILDTKEYHRRAESDELFDAFWEAAAEVKATLDHLSDLANPEKSKRRVDHPFVDGKVTYAETLGGRKRYVPPGARNWWTESRNMPVQGTGADILKRAEVEIMREARARKLDARILLTAHDEFIGEARADHAEPFKEIMTRHMAVVGQRYCPHVPITAEAYIADWWIKD
jgi:DNA polymerase I-like protein with 3'-5' exonuclease and polymerase domains